MLGDTVSEVFYSQASLLIERRGSRIPQDFGFLKICDSVSEEGISPSAHGLGLAGVVFCHFLKRFFAMTCVEFCIGVSRTDFCREFLFLSERSCGFFFAL